MAYKYFGDKRYLKAAQQTVDYLEKNIISKSDYFSSTLDANCEDKEAAISAVTATYYLAMVSKGKQRQHYIQLCQQAAYFALSWYYLVVVLSLGCAVCTRTDVRRLRVQEPWLEQCVGRE